MTPTPIILPAVLSFFIDRPTIRPSDWCCAELRFDETSYRGPFVLSGREYMIDVIDDFARDEVTDEVLVFGSQTGKTAGLMGGVAWCLKNDPCGFLWVMPNQDLARSFSENRWQKLLKASPGTADLIPTGAARHRFKNLEQQLGPSVVNFIGSNSPANLASRPARRVILDEVDKFHSGGGGEADAVNLAEQRTKDRPSPQRWKTSTPSMVEGLIWQEFLKGDQRRYFLPCPHCSKQILPIWGKDFTMLKLTGAEASVRWDKEARRDDGTWDLDRVRKSARLECPHCLGHILDAHKTLMLKNGEWKPTAQASANFVSRQLSSLYACSPDTNFGVLAVKFLQAKQSLLGLQGFINGDLAEPYMSQDRQRERVELISSALIEVGDEWHAQLTVDCQAKSPRHWYVKRIFSKTESICIDAGPCDTFEDIRRIQLAPGSVVQDICVCVDSGYGAKSDAEVYRQCARFGVQEARMDALPVHMGWMPSKGMPGHKRWKNEDGLMVPFYLQAIDPHIGTSQAGQVEMSLFEFASDFIKDVLEDLRQGKAGHKWSVKAEVAIPEYWKHMDSNIKTPVFNKSNGSTKHVWQKRSQHWPDHLLDCEVMQIALASFFEIFELKEQG